MDGLPIATVVVATYQRADRLPLLLASLESQADAPPFEVVIVDDGSRDATWTELQRLAASSRMPMRPIRQAHNAGPAAARNIGWRSGLGTFVAFTDDDCRPQPGWLRALCECLEDVDIVQGQTLPDPAQERTLGPFSHTMRVTGEQFYETCNVAYRREVLERAQGFDETFRQPYGEDFDLAWRAKEQGATSAYAPEALVFHDVTRSSFSAYVRQTRRLHGAALVLSKHPELRRGLHWRLFFRPSHPWALAALAGLVTAAIRPRRRLAGFVLGVPYVVYRVGIRPLPGRRRTRLVVIPLAFVGDLVEVARLAAASIRLRTLFL